jgi:hypothetical protein
MFWANRAAYVEAKWQQPAGRAELKYTGTVARPASGEPLDRLGITALRPSSPGFVYGG